MRSSYAIRGMSLVDVVVGSALVLIIFSGLFGILRLSLSVAGLARAKAVATSLVTSQMEYLRSLDYDDVGTSGGIPSGNVDQYATTTSAGIDYVLRTYIVYVDDPKDGEGALDATGITTDYKLAKVTAYYSVGGSAHEVTLISNIAPPGLETTTGGGTLRISTVNAAGTPVSGAAVRIVNSVTSPAIDFTTYSDSTGTVFLPGAPTSTDYQVYVTKDGYSSAQTYVRAGTNQNPTPGYLTVVQGQTTSGTFAIDLLSTLIVRTFSPIAPFVFSDAFSSSGNVSLTSTVVSGGAVTLAGGPGAYAASGTVLSTSTTPTQLAAWVSASSTSSIPAGTTVHMRIVDAAGTPIPDSVIPGNSGWLSGSINLSGVSTTTYPTLRLEARLTGDTLVTPSLLDWQLGYTRGPVPLPDVPFTVTGAKTIGSMSNGTPLYKTTIATTTDASGVRTLEVEWDQYQRVITGYTISDETPEAPYEVQPGTTLDAAVILTP